MKLVITTQCRENYAAHNGFNGTYHWKCKGGSTYIVPNLSEAHVSKIKAGGIPTLKSLIEDTKNDYYDEYILDYYIAADDAVVHEPWETPLILTYENGRWVATKTTQNGEYGYMPPQIEFKFEKYEMLPGGERANYSGYYRTVYGQTLPVQEV